MGLFKTKAEKEFETKQIIRKQIREFDRRVAKLEEQIGKHVESARTAIKENLPEQVNLAKVALSRTIQERKMTIRMKIFFEVMTQIKDMAEANKTFVKSIKTLSEQMEVANTIEVQKIFDKFDVEVEKANMMAEEIQDQLNVQESKYKKEEISEIKVTDSEIDTLIYGNKTLQASTSSVTDPLEKKLEELKAKIEKK
jgi:hypothetical protein